MTLRLALAGLALILVSAAHAEMAPATTLVERAKAYVDDGDLEAAKPLLDEALRLDPSAVEAYWIRGVIFDRDDDMSRALADYNEALRLNPNHRRVLILRSSLYGRRGDLRLAIDDANRALAIEPGDWRTLNNRCYYHAQAGNLDQALADCNASVQLLHHSVNFDSRGFVFLKRGELERARADFEVALGMGVRHSRSLYGRGIARMRLGEFNAGLVDLALASLLDPEIAAFYDKNGLKP